MFQTIVSKVTFPMFSTIAHDRERLKAAMRKCMTTIGAVVMPMMVGLALMAKPAVIVLFGAKWLPCVPYLRISGPGGGAVAAARGEPGRADGGRAIRPFFAGGGSEEGADSPRFGGQRPHQRDGDGLGHAGGFCCCAMA